MGIALGTRSSVKAHVQQLQHTSRIHEVHRSCARTTLSCQLSCEPVPLCSAQHFLS